MAIKTIVVKGEGIRYEALAVAAITPGNLVEFTSAGKVQKHSTAGGNAERAFAVEDDDQGSGIDTDYDADDLVQYEIFRPGDVVWAKLKDGETVAKGGFVESAGTGEMQAYVADSNDVAQDTIIGVSLDTLDMSDSSLADPTSNRFRLRII